MSSALLPSPPHPNAPPERWLEYDEALLRELYARRDTLRIGDLERGRWMLGVTVLSSCTLRRLMSREWVMFMDHGTRLALTESGRGVVR